MLSKLGVEAAAQGKPPPSARRTGVSLVAEMAGIVHSAASLATRGVDF